MPANNSPECNRLRALLRQLQLQLAQSSQHLRDLIDQHAPQNQINEWQQTVDLLAQEIQATEEEYRANGCDLLPTTEVLTKVSPQNIQVTHSPSPNNARSESALAINPLNPDQMIGASKKFTNPATYTFSLAAYASQDGGLSWSEPSLGLLPGWAGTSDPAVAWDNLGNAYLAALPFLSPTNPGDGASGDVIGIAVYKSADGGRTWGSPTLIHTSAGDDKQWATGDSNPASPHFGNVYAAWDDGSTLRFARTTDHGATWKGVGTQAAGSALADDSFSPELSVATDGTVYIVWLNGQSGSQIKFVKSIDGGNSFSAPQAAATGITSLRGPLPETGGFPHFPGATFRVLTLATGCTGTGGNVVFAWADYREGVSRIYYRRSTDEGSSWQGPALGQPLLTDANIPNLHHFHPQLIADPTGHVGCAFYEFGPKGGAGKNLIDVIFAVSLDGGQSFSQQLTVTDQPWDPAIDAPLAHGIQGITFIGEYFGLDASAAGFYPFWTDTRTGTQEMFTAHLAVVRRLVRSHIDSIVSILFGIINDGGGLEITPSGKPIRVPPRQPLYDIVSGLLIHELASQVEHEEGHALRMNALRLVSRAAEKEAQSLSRRTSRGPL